MSVNTLFGQKITLNSSAPPAKKPLARVEKVTKSNYGLHADLIKSSTKNYYNHTYRYSNEPASYDADSFFNWLQADELYVLTKDNRKLGYVVLHNNPTVENSIVSYSFFIHPRVCKLNSVHMSVGGFVLAAAQCLLLRARLITTYVNHTLLLNSFSNILPTKSIKLQEGLHYVYIDLSELSSSEIKLQLALHFEEEVLNTYYEI